MNYLMPKIKRFSVILSLIVISCQPDDSVDSGDVRDEYVGEWICTETSQIFGTSNYTVTITKDTLDDIIKVANLYNIGDQNQVLFTVFDNNISINTQTVEGNTFSGNGTSETDYSTFNLNYTAVSGGDSDNVTSTFTK